MPVLKHTKPAEPSREPTPEELAGYQRSIAARVERLNRITFLASQLNGAELEGLIVLAEAAVADRRSLVGLATTRAEEAIAYILPDGVF